MKYNKFSRRMFLQGTGGALVAIPLLSSLLPRETWAQTAAVHKRFISFFATLDLGHNANWLPNGMANLTNIPQPNRNLVVGGNHHDIKWQPLREFAPTGTSVLAPIYGSSLSPYLESMNILRSLDFPDFRGHDCARALGGARNYVNPDLGSLKFLPTIDRVINDNRQYNPDGLPMIFAGSGGHTEQWSLLNSNGSIVAGQGFGNLTELYNRLFRNGTAPEKGETGVAHPRREILNDVIEDFRRVSNSRNISSGDKLALSNAMDKFSDLQKSLNKVGGAQCVYRALPREGEVNAADNAAYGKVFADLVTAGILCDAARTFTFGIDHAGNPNPGKDVHQDYSHQPFAVTNGRVHWQIFGEMGSHVFKNYIAPLVQNLSSAIDPANGKSYLYNSLIFYSAEAGTVHSNNSLPAVLLGNAAGAITSGNYIDYADRNRGVSGAELFTNTPGDPMFCSNWRGVSYNRLLVTILQAMGLTPAAYENPALNKQLYNRTDIGDLNQNLTTMGGWGYGVAYDLTVKSYSVSEAKRNLPGFNFRQFGNKLPFPV